MEIQPKSTPDIRRSSFSHSDMKQVLEMWNEGESYDTAARRSLEATTNMLDTIVHITRISPNETLLDDEITVLERIRQAAISRDLDSYKEYVGEVDTWLRKNPTAVTIRISNTWYFVTGAAEFQRGMVPVTASGIVHATDIEAVQFSSCSNNENVNE